MEANFSLLAITALSIGVIHTIAGPDHYLPFVALSKTRSWTLTKTINVVIICGLGHVLSSVVIGFIGIGAGIALHKVEWIEGIRGNVAAWLLFIFGISYTIWAVFRLIQKRGHHHNHSDKRTMTFWILFTIFVFGPCEPLIPILMYPAAQSNYLATAIIAGIFSVATIGTMLVSVIVVLKGISFIRINMLEKYQHVLAGSALVFCGASILFLGL